MAVVCGAVRNGAPEGSWLARMLARKPRMLVAIALANKLARAVWAMLVKQEDYGTRWRQQPDRMLSSVRRGCEEVGKQ